MRRSSVAQDNCIIRCHWCGFFFPQAIKLEESFPLVLCNDCFEELDAVDAFLENQGVKKCQ